MSSQRCEITDLYPDQCAHCRGLKDPAPLPKPRVTKDRVPADPFGTTAEVGTEGRGPIFTARYGGICEECGEEIHPGDSIQAWDGAYAHEECW